MVKNASDEFIQKVREMSDEELLREYDVYRARMDNLEAERMQCWNRMMEISGIQDEMGGELQCLVIVIHYGRKLK
jgi:hypothetical protein